MEMTKAIHNLIWQACQNDSVAGNDYLEQSIIISHQHKYALPPEEGQIIVLRLDSISVGRALETYDGKLGQKVINSPMATKFQVGFYGIYAYQVASVFQAMLASSYATNYLTKYGYSVYQVSGIQRLSSSLAKDSSGSVHLVNFSLFHNTIVTYAQEGFTSIDIEPINAGLVSK